MQKKVTSRSKKNPSRTNPTICIWHSLSVVESNGQFASKFWRLKRCPIWTLRCKACRICSESGLFGRENLFPPTKKNLKMASLDWQKLPSSDWRPNSWGGGRWCYVFSHWVQNKNDRGITKHISHLGWVVKWIWISIPVTSSWSWLSSLWRFFSWCVLHRQSENSEY